MLFYRQVIRTSEPKQQVSYSKSVSIELSDNKDLFLSWPKNILLCLNTRWEGHIQPRNLSEKRSVLHPVPSSGKVQWPVSAVPEIKFR